METARFYLAMLMLAAAALVATLNWACVIVSWRNARRGIDRHHSTVPLMSLILALVATKIDPRPELSWMFVIPLCDAANWSLVWLPVWLTLEASRKQSTQSRPDADSDSAASTDASAVIDERS